MYSTMSNLAVKARPSSRTFVSERQKSLFIRNSDFRENQRSPFLAKPNEQTYRKVFFTTACKLENLTRSGMIFVPGSAAGWTNGLEGSDGSCF